MVKCNAFYYPNETVTFISTWNTEECFGNRSSTDLLKPEAIHIHASYWCCSCFYIFSWENKKLVKTIKSLEKKINCFFKIKISFLDEHWEWYLYCRPVVSSVVKHNMKFIQRNAGMQTLPHKDHGSIIELRSFFLLCCFCFAEQRNPISN